MPNDRRGQVVVPMFKETFHRHLADKLVREATGVTVWVVKEAPANL